MAKKLQSFCCAIPIDDPAAMAEFQKIMDANAEATNKYILEITKELDVSDSCAMDVVYLRGRSRWTQELENKLIKLHKENKPPNVYEFGHEI